MNPHALNQFADGVEAVAEPEARKCANLARRGPEEKGCKIAPFLRSIQQERDEAF